MIIKWIVFVIFLIMTITFYMGKGAWLIAGYNTSSKEEKAKIDEKKLCRVMGNGMAVVTASIFLACVFEERMQFITMIAVMGAILYIMIVGNTRCKRDTNQVIQQELSSDKKSNVARYVAIFFSILTTIVVVCLLFICDVTITVDKTGVRAKATLVTTTEIAYKDIKNVALVKDISIGNRTNGLGDFKVNAGHFKNETYGNYMLYCFKSCNTYIVITLQDNSIVVLNEHSLDTTKDLYKEIQSNI